MRLSESRPTAVPLSLSNRARLWHPPPHPRPLPRPLLPPLDESAQEVPAKAEGPCAQDAASTLGGASLSAALHQGSDLTLFR